MSNFDNKTYQAEWYRKNQDRIKAARRERYKNKKSQILESNASWVKAHPEVVRANKLRWQRKNKQSVYAYNAAWRNRNPEMVQQYNRMHRSRYRARMRNQLHPSHDKQAEKALFTECAAITIRTRIPHHVDHIIPLKVGGWHHHSNLQILPGSINRSKSADPFLELQGYKSWRDVPRELWPTNLVTEYLSRC